MEYIVECLLNLAKIQHLEKFWNLLIIVRTVSDKRHFSVKF